MYALFTFAFIFIIRVNSFLQRVISYIINLQVNDKSSKPKISSLM